MEYLICIQLFVEIFQRLLRNRCNQHFGPLPDLLRAHREWRRVLLKEGELQTLNFFKLSIIFWIDKTASMVANLILLLLRSCSTKHGLNNISASTHNFITFHNSQRLLYKIKFHFSHTTGRKTPLLFTKQRRKVEWRGCYLQSEFLSKFYQTNFFANFYVENIYLLCDDSRMICLQIF